MKWKYIFLTSILSVGLCIKSTTLLAESISDTCTVNDRCENAIPIFNVEANQAFVCIEGCNVGATPEIFNNSCHIGVYPTVWFSVFTEGGTLMNIQVTSDEIESPVITLFQMLTDCNDLVQIPQGINNLPCVTGSNGVASAFGTDIGSNIIYLIAISSLNSTGGAFTLCINTVSNPSTCVKDSDITIESRSSGSGLSAPFIPGEQVRICMNVHNYSAQDNGCQWFQGLVPVFGNGWDPNSFTPDLEPKNATINGNPIAEPGNGLYGSATWDWFTDVDYHFDDTLRQLGDIDGNGTLDMCSIVYDPDCPNLGGLSGTCCAPCWESSLGSILPPGWFAYGINGSCERPGPPIRVDWGDGNSCGERMGPWSFCFDLKVRDYPECIQDETTSDLSIGFFTFADGETGAWTGGPSVCANDQPVQLRFPMTCKSVTEIGVDYVDDKCFEDVFEYQISYPGIENWTWSISPAWAVTSSAKEGENGFLIQDTIINTSTEPVEVIYYFTGHEEGTSGLVVLQVHFTVYPAIKSELPEAVIVCERDQDTIFLSSDPVTGGATPYSFLWNPGGETTSSIKIPPLSSSSTFVLNITDEIGCVYSKEVAIKVHPCHLDSIMTDDESNEDHTFEDPPLGGGKINSPGSIPMHIEQQRISAELKVYPVPATDIISLEWPQQIMDALSVDVLDMQGNTIHTTTLANPKLEGRGLKIDIQSFSDGVYIVYLRTSRSIYTAKFLKM